MSVRVRFVSRLSAAASVLAAALGIALVSLKLCSCVRSGFDTPTPSWEAVPRALCQGDPVAFVCNDGGTFGLRITPDVGELDVNHPLISYVPQVTKTYDLRARDATGAWYDPSSTAPIEVKVLQSGDAEKLWVKGTSQQKNDEPPCVWELELTVAAYSASVWVDALRNPMSFPLLVVHHDASGNQDLSVTLPAAMTGPQALGQAVQMQGRWQFIPTDPVALDAAIAADPNVQSCLEFPIQIVTTVLCR